MAGHEEQLVSESTESITFVIVDVVEHTLELVDVVGPMGVERVQALWVVTDI